jgi:PAS domain S-box-containing protein
MIDPSARRVPAEKTEPRLARALACSLDDPLDDSIATTAPTAHWSSLAVHRDPQAGSGNEIIAVRRRLLEDLVIDPEEWQRSLLAIILRVSVVLGFMAYLPSIYASFQFGLFGLAAVDTIGLATVIGLHLADRLPHRWRATIFCLVFYALSVGLLIAVGPISQIYLFAFSILTTLLLGLRAGVFSALLNAATLFAVGAAGAAAQTMVISNGGRELFGWVTVTVNFVFVNILLTLGIGAVIAALNDALMREVAARVSLERERSVLRTLIDALPDVVFTKDTNGVYLNANPATLAQLGLRDEAQLAGKTVFDLLPRDLALSHHAEDLAVVAGRPMHNQEERTVDRAGNPIWYLTIKVPLRDAGGAIVGLIGISRDITDRKQAEAGRIRALAQLQLQIERMPLAYLLSDADLNYSRWNPTAERMFGFREAEIIGKHPFDVIVPPQSQPWLTGIFDRIRAGDMEAHGESENRTGDGRTIICEWYNTPLFEESGEFVGLLSLAQDVTDRKNLESQLRQSQKMEAIGQLAGGVAHDFNNILAIIQMEAGFLKGRGGLSPVQSDSADAIVETVERAAALTRQLLLFSSREVFQPRDLDLGESIADTTKMLQRIVGEHIRMRLKLASQPMLLHADGGMIDQILLNLVVNARDAMPDGGDLVIETSAVDFDEFAASQSAPMRVGSFVCLSVSDSGTGIPPEILPKIFEPFFTTKDVGKGTGLGLATVFGIVRQHQGWIDVYSEIGHGTTFRIYLPRLARDAASQPAQPARPAVHGGSETILLVEDDPRLRASLRTALAQLGYRVIEAPTGVKGLAAWTEHRHEIRLLLTDLVMPDGMSGKDLAERIRGEDPGLKAIFMSGYSAEVVSKDFPMREGVNFLTKPFQAHKLAEAVRNCLDAD